MGRFKKYVPCFCWQCGNVIERVFLFPDDRQAGALYMNVSSCPECKQDENFISELIVESQAMHVISFTKFDSLSGKEKEEFLQKPYITKLGCYVFFMNEFAHKLITQKKEGEKWQEQPKEKTLRKQKLREMQMQLFPQLRRTKLQIKQLRRKKLIRIKLQRGKNEY